MKIKTLQKLYRSWSRNLRRAKVSWFVTDFVAKHSCALSPAASTVKLEWPTCVCGYVSNLWIISQALSLGSSGFGARLVWRCKRHERISFLSPPCYHTVYDQMAPLSKHLGHPCLRACAKECLLYYEQCPVFRECRMFRKFALNLYLPFRPTMILYRENYMAVS